MLTFDLAWIFNQLLLKILEDLELGIRVSAAKDQKEHSATSQLSTVKQRNQHLSFAEEKCKWKQTKKGGLRCVKLDTEVRKTENDYDFGDDYYDEEIEPVACEVKEFA